MNKYRSAMEHCMPPEELENRLRETVLHHPAPARRRAIRPLSFARRIAVAAAIILALTASAGAAFLLHWDDIFAARFGQEAADLPITGAAFQNVDVTAVCDEVALTVREVLGDNKNIYLILDYHLPADIDPDAVQRVWDSETDSVGIPPVFFFATGDVTWQELKAETGHLWPDTDWGNDSTGAGSSLLQGDLYQHRFHGGSSSQSSAQSYDAETKTLTYLIRYTTNSSSQNLTDQPLTLLVFPPVMRVGSDDISLAHQPALLTFRPEYSARAKTGEVQMDDPPCRAEVTLSPFAISVSYYGTGYEDTAALRLDTRLVYKNGQAEALSSLTSGWSGSGSVSPAEKPDLREFDSAFRSILDPDTVTAVRIGDITVPLK